MPGPSGFDVKVLSQANWQSGPQAVSVTDLYKSYEGWCTAKKMRSYTNPAGFGKAMHKHVARSMRVTDTNGTRVRMKEVDDLQTAKAAFAKQNGLSSFDELEQ